MSGVESVLLGVHFGEEVGILLLSVDQEVFLVVDLLSESADHVDVDLDS